MLVTCWGQIHDHKTKPKTEDAYVIHHSWTLKVLHCANFLLHLEIEIIEQFHFL